MSSETRPAVLRKLAYHYRTPQVANSVGISLELLKRFAAGSGELTSDQLTKLDHRIQQSMTQRYR